MTSNFFSQLNTCGHSPHVTFSLRRGWVCNLQLMLALVTAVILRSESCRIHDHILLCQIRDSPNLEGQVPQEQGGPDIPQALSSLLFISYDSQDYGADIQPHLHMGDYQF
jgi:hypothetical protein